MFSNLNNSDFIEIFILMLGSFLIGYFFAYYYFKNKLDSFNSNFDVNQINDQIENIAEGEIKAKKTFDRGGKEVEYNRQKKIAFDKAENKKKPKEDIAKKPNKKA